MYIFLLNIFLGYQNQDSVNEELWDKSLAKIGNENVHNSSFWSGFLMFSVFFVVPYIIHKISNNIRNLQVKGKHMLNCYLKIKLRIFYI